MQVFTAEEKRYFMREALKEAQKSLAKEEIPIGCVLVKDGQIIGRGHNAREDLGNTRQTDSTAAHNAGFYGHK